jgi:D-glycero-alpha-D-manno-heptose-7-phosphate kinase
VIRVSAPVRICDCGGWTDTWFAGRGSVVHLAVQPGVEVRLLASPGGAEVRAHLTSYGESYAFAPGRGPMRHPIVEAAFAAVPPPPGLAIELTIASDMPPGAGTGTSAAVSVALVAALSRLAGLTPSPAAIAREAHAIETERLGRQSGIQDQIAAAHGGINFVNIRAYPDAEVLAIEVPAEARIALDQRLVFVYLGRAHHSSAVHRAVIDGIVSGGGAEAALDRLRSAAIAARDALASGDLRAFGRALAANTEAQAALHPALISPDARLVGALGQAAGAWGWKVNGAGGDGGSVAVLLGPDAPASARRRLGDAIGAKLPSARLIPIRLSPDGVRATG